ncbi:MAG: SufD family Fe-S cluster assembly protein [Methanosarcinales archaeon]|nr:SufD family Fe-S cluster assembly protein [Methanosarcinales archaeon]
MTDEYRTLVEAYARYGGEVDALNMPDVAHLLVHGNRVLSSRPVPGLDIHVEETGTGVKIKLVILKGYRIEHPVHLCFGVLPKEGIQQIDSVIIAEEGASVELLAHCTFPNATRVRHVMNAEMEIQRDATITYNETHYHGPHGGVEVVPKARVSIERGGRLTTGFTLTEGRVGRLEMDYDVHVGEGATADMSVKVYGRGDDDILIRERTVLAGEEARSVIKSRVAVRDRARSTVESITEGAAPYSRGHVDCVEIVQDDAVAVAIPRVSVVDRKAKVTHEAAIGSVDKKQMETLMSRGLDESEAVDVIIRGLLR